MEREYLCLGCMSNKGIKSICPFCGFSEDEYDQDGIALKLGTELNGRYIVGRTLGSGGFGITYLAWDEMLEVPMAIKEYLPNTLAMRTADESTVKANTKETEQQFSYYMDRFLEEARTLAKFNDENGIVSVQDVFKANGTIYIVMYYVNGIDLNQYLKDQGGKLAVDDALKIMKVVLKSLSKVHDSGLVHRDISPDNIFITIDNQVKLLDFGASRYTVGQGEKTISVILKHGFAPIEQYSSKGKQGPWTDVYASAATLYKLITGIKPPEAIERLTDDLIKMPSELGISIETHVEMALMKALEIKENNRFKHMSAFLASLEDEQSKTVLSQDYDIPTGKVTNKKRTIVIVIVALIACVTIAFGLISTLSERDDNNVSQGTGAEQVESSVESTENSEVETTSEAITELTEESTEVAEKTAEETREETVEEDTEITEESSSLESEVVENNDQSSPSESTTKSIGSDNHVVNTFEIKNLLGSNYNIIGSDLNGTGISITIENEIYSEQYPENTIISQNVSPGTKLKAGDTITVVISKGSEFVNVPRFVNMTKNEAVSLADENFITVEVSYQETTEVEAGVVISQEPLSGQVKKGSKVKLTVASKKADSMGYLNRTITSYLSQEYNENTKSFDTILNYSKLPSNLQGINGVRVTGTDTRSKSNIDAKVTGSMSFDSFSVSNGRGIYSSSGDYYNQHIIRLGKDGVLVAYILIHSDTEIEVFDDIEVDLSNETKEIPDLAYEIKTMSEQVYQSKQSNAFDMAIRETDVLRELPFGVKQVPKYDDDSFDTIVTRAALPESLRNINQVDITGTNMSIDECVDYNYREMNNGTWPGLRTYTKNDSVMIFSSSGNYYHDEIIMLVEDSIIKGAIKINPDGSITYKLID